jgi:secreted trypsin-like serine protease
MTPGGIKMTRQLSSMVKVKSRNPRLLAAALALVFLSTVSFVSASSTQEPTDILPRIIGGSNTTVEEWPSVVALVIRQDSENNLCGGTLIAPNWVLTAAHCLVDDSGNRKKAADLLLVLNTTGLNSQSNEQRGVTNIIVHPNYVSTIKGNDIALLELSNQSEQRTMALYSGKPEVGTEATVVGWGVTGYDAQNNAQYSLDNLQKANVPVVSNEICNRPESYNSTIIDSQLCAGLAEGGKDSCQGDSGGPLMAMQDGQYRQVGIVSYGGGCAKPNKYGIYTRVSSFWTWIEDFTGALGARESNPY